MWFFISICGRKGYGYIMICPKCKAENKNNSAFCAGCGSLLPLLDEESEVVAEVELPPVPPIFSGNYVPRRFTEQKPKKKHTGVIIAIVAVLFVLAAAVAVIIGQNYGFEEILSVFKTDQEKSSSSAVSTTLPLSSETTALTTSASTTAKPTTITKVTATKPVTSTKPKEKKPATTKPKTNNPASETKPSKNAEPKITGKAAKKN